MRPGYLGQFTKHQEYRILPYIESNHWSIQQSAVCTDWQQFSSISGRELPQQYVEMLGVEPRGIFHANHAPLSHGTSPEGMGCEERGSILMSHMAAFQSTSHFPDGLLIVLLKQLALVCITWVLHGHLKEHSGGLECPLWNLLEMLKASSELWHAVCLYHSG